jgi:hypothetical protein
MRKTEIAAIVSTTVLMTCIAARWSFEKYYRLPQELVSKQSLADIDAFGDYLQSVASKTRNGTMSPRKVNLSTIGFPEEEGELRSFRHWLQVYVVTRGEIPKQSSQMATFFAASQLPSNQRSAARRSTEQCNILHLGNDSYALSCDNWNPPDPSSLARITQTFDPETERFYILDGHVILFAPPPTRLPKSSGSPLAQ